MVTRLCGRKQKKKKKKKRYQVGRLKRKKEKKEGAEKKAAFECKKCQKKIIYSYRLKLASLPEWPSEFPEWAEKKKKITPNYQLSKLKKSKIFYYFYDLISILLTIYKFTIILS